MPALSSASSSATIIPAAPARGPVARGETLVFFQLGHRRCALPQAEVRELLPLPRLWRPPGAPRFVAGFFELGGQAQAVLRLALLLEAGNDAPAAPPTADGAPSAAGGEGVGADTAGEAAGLYRHLLRTIPLRGAASGLLLLVDRVLDVRAVPAGAVQPVGAGHSLNDCVTAEVTGGEDGALVHLLSAERLLLARERGALASLEAEAARRMREWEAGTHG